MASGSLVVPLHFVKAAVQALSESDTYWKDKINLAELITHPSDPSEGTEVETWQDLFTLRFYFPLF